MRQCLADHEREANPLLNGGNRRGRGHWGLPAPSWAHGGRRAGWNQWVTLIARSSGSFDLLVGLGLSACYSTPAVRLDDDALRFKPSVNRAPNLLTLQKPRRAL